MINRLRLALLFSGSLLAHQASAAELQTSGPPAAGEVAAAGGSPTQVGEVVVTARRVSESLQKTPVAVTAVTGAALTNRGAADISAVAQIAPNVTFETTASNSGSSNAAVVFIRGIGQSDFYPQVDPGVGIYLDGVYISRSTGAVLDAVDIGQVEVLRGPQGTLYGKNTIGGAINITSRAPSRVFGGYADITTGSYSRIDAKGRLDVPLSDRLRTSLSFATLNRDGYYDQEDFSTKQVVGHLGDISALTARFAADYDATSRLTFQFSADWTRRQEESSGSTLLQVNPNGLAPVVNNVVVAPDTPYDSRYIPFDPYVNYGDPKRSKSDLDVYGVALTTRWKALDWLTVKAVTAYRISNADSDRDGDDSPAVILQPATKIDQSQFSQELQFLGDAFDKRLTFIAGGYFLNEDIFFDAPVNIAFVDTSNTAQITNRSYAVFGQIGYKITDKLRLTLGGRYTIDQKENDARVFATRLIDPGSLMAVPAAALPVKLLVDDAKREDTKFTPAVTLDYQFTPTLFGYATYSEGFKSGGFSQRIAFPRIAAPAFDPESVKNYEAGVKVQAFNRHLTLNSAAFYVDYSNLQVIIFNNVEPLTQNGGKATLKGFESEMQLVPMRGLTASLAAGYIDAGYDQIAPGTLIPPDAHLAYTPKWTASGTLSYEREFSGWKVRPQVDFSYRSAVNFDALNTPALRQSGYVLVGVNVAVTDPSALWRVSVGVTNLTDERYIIGGFSDLGSSGFTDATYARPREWYLSLRRTF